MKNILLKLLLVFTLSVFLVSCDAEDDVKYTPENQADINENFISYKGTKYALTDAALLYQGYQVVSAEPLILETIWFFVTADYQPPYIPGDWSDFLVGAPASNYYYMAFTNRQNHADFLEFPAETTGSATYEPFGHVVNILQNDITLFNEADEPLYSDLVLNIKNVDYDALTIDADFSFKLEGEEVYGNYNGSFDIP